MSALILDTANGDQRHFLSEKAVHCGSFLELRVAEDVDGKQIWIPVRYEATLDRFGDLTVTLHTFFGIIHPRYSKAELRWPAKE